ncbi:sensor histidine kinase [Aureitalea sp. L0-47]|uniref:tetratricopeptide repeat-containing sensor histidine kinase n=1 Tax=Aureitalea sp. L0-47 TaxID=2816962 RepID=UPI002237541C|nr:sensor histidine kinase [Aureitalea sp. L0-47]MCW5520015.1 sensor histidine kinase [Aureitalea sp. L0-47]
MKRILFLIVLSFPSLLISQKEVSIDSVLLFATRNYTAQPDSAQYYLHKGIQLAEAIDDDYQKGLFLTKLIQQKTRIRDYDSARFYFRKAHRFLREAGQDILLPDSHSEIAETYYYMEKMDSALYHFKQADSLYAKDGDSIGVLISKNNVANVYQILGNYEGAIENMLQAIKNVDTTQYLYIKVQLYLNVSELYQQIEEPSLARHYAKKSLDLSLTNTNYPDDMVMAYIKLAGYATEDKEYEKASEYNQLAQGVVDDYNLDMIQFQVSKSNANLLIAEESYEEAILEINQALKIAEQAKRNDFEVFSLRKNLGICYAKTNKPQQAISLLNEVLDNTIEDGRLDDISSVYFSLSEAHESLGDYRAAIDNYKMYRTYNDSILGKDKQVAIRDAMVKYETERKERDLAETRADLAEKELEVRNKNMLIFGGFGLAILLGLLGYLFYNQQKLKNRQLKKEAELQTALARIETQNQLQEQRLRISRDLHDNIGSQLTFIISSVDNLKFGLKDGSTAVTDKLGGISRFASETIYELRDTIWAMNKNSITFEDLQVRISNFIEKARESSSNIEFDFSISEEIPKDHKFTSIVGMNLYRIIQEAVNNALKYSEGTLIRVKISGDPSAIKIEISDDGKGFDPAAISMGNGIRNMRKRAQDIKAKINITSDDNEGTKVKLVLASE